MAILNNLIVNGTARFLNTVYADDVDISGDLAAATITSSGALKGASLYLNNTLAMDVNSSTLRINSASAFSNGINFGNSKIAASGAVNLTGTTTATTLNTTTIKNSGNIYNTNGRVETDEIRSNVWDIVSTQNLGGDFFVAPTIMVKDGSTFGISSVSGNSITGYIIDTTNITADNFGGHTWSNNSKIKITGKLTNGNNTYVLGVCDGKLNANMNGTNHRIDFTVTCNASVVPPALSNGNTYTITDGTVMMYNVGGSNKVGIYMTCYGTDKYTYIDVYNGSNGNKPVARLGKLNGLDAINNMSPDGYGIYTTNGYYQGKIVANGGVIGGYTIGTSALYSGSHSAYNTNEDGIFMDATWLAGGKQAAWYLKSDGSAKIGAMTLTSAGVLSVPAANITNLSASVVSAVKAEFTTLSAITANMGTLTSGTITTNSSRTTYDGTAAGLTLTTSGIGAGNGTKNTFKVVAATGALTSTDATITGNITATTGTIGGVTANSSYGLYTNSKTSATSTQTGFLISKDGAIYLGSYNTTTKVCPFQVTSAGVLTATGATINGTLTAGSGSKIGPWNITDTAIYKTNATMGNATAGAAYFGNDGLSITDKFKVTAAGALTATGVDVTGIVNATTGTFGNATNKITVGTGTNGHSAIRYGMTTLDDTSNNGFYVGTDGIALGKGVFKVTSAGALTATNADITGDIIATTGYIGGTTGWKIETNRIRKGDIGTDDSLWLTTANVSSTTIAGETGEEWRLTIGPNFGVKKSGTLYAKNAVLDGNNVKIQIFNSDTNGGMRMTAKSDGVTPSYKIQGGSYAATFSEDGLTFGQVGSSSIDAGIRFDGIRLIFEKTAPRLDSGIGLYATHSTGSSDEEGSLIGLNSSHHIVIGYGNATYNGFSKNFNMYTSSAAGNSFNMYLTSVNSSGQITNTEVFAAGATSGDVTQKYLRAIGAYQSSVATNYPLYVTSNGRIGKSSSSIRYKNSVVYLTNPENRTWDNPSLLSTEKVSENLADILKIPVVRYHYNKGHFEADENYDYSRDEIGMIAEDVAAITPHCATYMKDDNGKNIPESWNEREFIPRILYVLQQQQKEIDRLKELLKG